METVLVELGADGLHIIANAEGFNEVLVLWKFWLDKTVLVESNEEANK
jgi:hypothetical protein